MTQERKRVKAAIFGASGYSGGELLRILTRHPGVAVEKVFAHSSAGTPVSEIHSWYGGQEEKGTRTFASFSSAADTEADVCFLALPHGEAMEVAPKLIAAGKLVIDLSGDHRLQDTALFEKYYKRPQTSTEILPQAVYGLPEWSAEAIRSARLIANPGCYATSIILALAPALKEGMLDPASIVVNSMSGVSGAGRKAAIEYSFTEVNETVKAYRVGDHQHIPEIETALATVTGVQPVITFIPHLIPITRGIYTTITATLKEGATSEAMLAQYERCYAAEPFVRFRGERVPEIRSVLHTNFIDIGLRVLEGRRASEASCPAQVVIMSTIDNLVKGAAGQAVQNMNLACGFPEKEGLL